MRAVTAVALGAVLLALFLGLVAVLVLQEGGRWRSRAGDPREYVLTDAAAWVKARVGSRHPELSNGDVLRILEWQVFYLQESVRGAKRGEASVIVGDTPAAADFVLERTAAQGKAYTLQQVRAVLDEQGSYLMSIGAVAERAEREDA